ncbi:MAG: CAP domain-containing protein [Cyanobacteria bacterium P01_D01_bin.50]
MLSNLFDPVFYRSANSGLSELSDSQAWSHFKNYGLENGLDFSPIVNLDFYRASNSDLADLNNKEAYENLVNYGISQGRKTSPIVDLEFYGEHNSDLNSLNNEELFEHLKNNGIAEGRSFSQIFNFQYYLAENPDVTQNVGKSYTEAFNYFVTEGLNQGESFSPAFDAEFYKNAHTDLAATSLDNEQLLEHFVINGLNEGRKSAPGFDVEYYLNNNPGLDSFSYNEAFKHFVTVGLYDGLAASEYISDFAGNTLDSARKIALDSGKIVFRDSIGNSDSDDFYHLTLNNANSDVEVLIKGLNTDADLELLNSSGDIIASASNNRSFGESLNVENLEDGAYYIRVFQGIETANSNYNLSLSVTPTEAESEVIVLNESISVPDTPAAPTPQSASTSPSTNPLIDEVVALTNTYRIQEGLQPLALNASLSNAAQSHSVDMAVNDFFSHQGSNGTTVGTRTAAAGYESPYVGENIAAGYITAEEVVRGWMNSPGHRENILNPNYQEIGIGYHYLENDTGEINYNTYWTQNFGLVV